MPSERIQRRVDRLLDEAESAADQQDWLAVHRLADEVLGLDSSNEDAPALVAAAERRLGGSDRVLSGEAVVVAASESAPSVEAPSSFANGRYLVRRFLGEGGKKKVYLAHDELLDRDVAFALIKTEGLDAASRARIAREAQAMGRLGSHPHIVTVFDLGEIEGQPYIVTELMGGGDVEGVIEKAEEQRPPLEQALRVALEVCAGLEFAHSRGIVHRDLKPGNVWLTADGIAKIGDFGLAVAIDRSRLTQAGMMVGTVSYMPPEQATGGEVTARSDLYSLGAMLYELVCGRPPFVGDESVAIIGQHLNTPPVAPSWHRKDIPPGLEALILRLLAKDPNQRPASAAEVSAALAGIDLTSTPALAIEAQEAAEDPVYRQTFVGRDPELKQLQAAFDGALSGQGGLVMVVGEPGIGKTALCEQLATYVAIRGGRVLRGNCYEEGSLSLPYLAFVEALRSYVLSREPSLLRDELGADAGYVARIVSEVRDRAGIELAAVGDPEDDRWRLLQAVTSFVRHASEVQPLALLLEDLHWSDRGTLDLLQHLARNLAGARLLVVGTYRDVEVDRSHPLSSSLAELRRTGSFASLRLRGLGAEAVHTMLERIAQREVSWTVAEQVHRQTEGHPLFVQEVLRYLVEEGVLARDAGGRLQRQGDTPLVMQIPEGLRDVIGKRISRLSLECNRVLAVAAVIGRDFAFDTLTAVAGLPEESLMGAIEDALRIGVLQEQSSTVGTPRYRFAHAFFRQTLYEELIAPRRLRLHQEVARALEAQYGRRLDDHAAELAEHFSYSTDPADLAKAVQYAERAAKRALAVFDYGEASRLLEKALGVQDVLDPDDVSKRCDLLLALGDALMPAGEPLRAAEVVAPAAFALAVMLNDSSRCARASALGLYALQQYGGPPAAGTPAFREWATRADHHAQPETIERLAADWGLARVATSDGRTSDSNGLRLHALTVARELGDNEALFYAAFGFFSAVPANALGRALELAHEFSARPREGVSSRTVVEVLYGCAVNFLTRQERDRAEEAWREMASLAQQTGDANTILRAMVPEMTRATLDGRFDDALEAAASLIARGQELGSPVQGLVFAEEANVARVLLGQASEALERLDARTSVSGGTAWLVQYSRRGVYLANLGRTQEAAAVLALFWAKVADDAATLQENQLGLLLSFLDIALLIGDVDSARELAEAVRPFSNLAIVTPGARTCARLLGAAATLLGRPNEARTYYLEALEVATRIRFRPEIALIHLHLAELLLDHYSSEAAEAQEHLDFAIEEFRAMKMQPSLERALRHKGLLKA